jgi:copper(I)-binding protein
MRGLLILSLALLALPGCKPKSADKPQIRDAWVRLAAVPGRPAAGYFTIVGGSKDDRLMRIDSAVVKSIELHQNNMAGGMMSMKPMANVPVAAGTMVEFAPSGNHAMLFDVDARITPGTAIPMLFTFASGAAIEAEAKTVPAGGDEMPGMGH